MQRDEYGLVEGNEKIAKQVRILLMWSGGAPEVKTSFWGELEKLSELYDATYGGHEEYT